MHGYIMQMRLDVPPVRACCTDDGGGGRMEALIIYVLCVHEPIFYVNIAMIGGWVYVRRRVLHHRHRVIVGMLLISLLVAAHA